MTRGSPEELKQFERAVQRLKESADYRLVVEGLCRRLDAMKNTLMVKSGDDLVRQQGRALELNELLTDLNKTPKE